nr:unnamed protein product [Callosobruchus chinensis]
MDRKKVHESDIEDEEQYYTVEKIIDRRVVDGKIEYFLKWEGYTDEDNTWEPKENLNCAELVAEFENARKLKSKADNPTSEHEEQYYPVEKIIDQRVVDGKIEYFLKWEGYTDEDNTWEPKENLNLNCAELVAEFENARKLKSKADNPTSEHEEQYYPVEKIIDQRVVDGKIEYFLKWEGYTDEDNTWEPKENLNLNCAELVAEFENARKLKSKAGGKTKKRRRDNTTSSVKSDSAKSAASPASDEEKKAQDSGSDIEKTKKKRKSAPKSKKPADSGDSEDEKPKKKKKEKSFYKKKADDSNGESSKKSRKSEDKKGAKKEKTAFEKGLEPEQIIGATDIAGQLLLLMKWKGTEKTELVDAKEANIKCPQLVIKFYEEQIGWVNSDEW